MPHKPASGPQSGGGVALGSSDGGAVSRFVTYAPPVPLAPTWPVVRWVQPSLRDWADAQSFAPERRLGTRLAVPFAAASILGGFVSGFFGWPTGLLHLLGLYHVVERLLPWLSLLEQRADLEGPGNLVRVTVSPDELVIDHGFCGGYREPSTSRHRWQELAGYYPSPHALVLIVAESELVLLPRAAFTEPEFGLVAALLGHKLGPVRPARWRGALRPLAVSALVLALWAFWQAQF